MLAEHVLDPLGTAAVDAEHLSAFTGGTSRAKKSTSWFSGRFESLLRTMSRLLMKQPSLVGLF